MTHIRNHLMTIDVAQITQIICLACLIADPLLASLALASNMQTESIGMHLKNVSSYGRLLVYIVLIDYSSMLGSVS